MRTLRAIAGLGVLLAILAGVAWYASPAISERVALLGGKTVYPRIVPARGVSGEITGVREFVFEGRKYRIEAPADLAVYEGARASRKSAVRLREFSGDDWIDGYYRSFVADERQQPLYEAILAELRYHRGRLQLDDDRYLELACAMIQSIPYEAESLESAPKFPVQTWIERTGDCDDKTLLLAALLSSEGYDVAVFYFAEEKHVALGVRVDDTGYRGTGYAFVETTRQSLVGFVPEKLANGQQLRSEPRVIRIGRGDRRYRALAQVETIRGALTKARERQDALRGRIEDSRRRIAEAERQLQAQRAEAESARDQASLEAAVAEYRASYDRYKLMIQQDAELVGDYNRAIDVEKRIHDGQTDRVGLYRYARGISW